MSEYDVEKQREAAIESLLIKKYHLRVEIDQCFAAFKEHKHQSVFQSIVHMFGSKKKQKVQVRPSVDIDKLRVIAVRISHIELLIKRLKDGEDPRIILYEVVSNDRV